ncbi:hypothetical protein CLV58_11348 [Spirosoma oryzae]|uniref:GDSL-like lipase/acylhydrolase family protein n=1 Tax=Spirosoma oryzae TaxID=1469603 RepID=A0A2T0SR90_9BACT|nr:hypothetical protein [Spirosoma oryzae]PRY35920.1 hypothetical protein CLV58_11348 [Spirosoma oryzae]
MKKLLFLLLLAGCSPGVDSPDNPQPDPGTTNLGNGQPGVVGLDGIDAWDKLASSEKERIKSWNTLFLHQSVGQDLEEGAKANGITFDYFGSKDVVDKGSQGKGLRGGIFVDVGGISNGNPADKMRVFKEAALRSKTTLRIAIFKFGYADILDANRDGVKTAYKTFVDELRQQIPGLRFVHVTPPLVYATTADEGNAAKASVGQWMRDTFKNTDVIFDLQSLETNNGACQQNTVPRICPDNRASITDPSEVNGVDSDGQGHLGKKAAQRISKAFLYAIYQAGK